MFLTQRKKLKRWSRLFMIYVKRLINLVGTLQVNRQNMHKKLLSYSNMGLITIIR